MTDLDVLLRTSRGGDCRLQVMFGGIWMGYQGFPLRGYPRRWLHVQRPEASADLRDLQWVIRPHSSLNSIELATQARNCANNALIHLQFQLVRYPRLEE